MTFMLMNLSLSFIFLYLTHPLSMGLILLMQTMLISFITGNYFFNYWFSYIIFLIMIGGMLILFMYMTNVASNEKFKPNFYLITYLLMTFMSINILNYYTKMEIINLDNKLFNFEMNTMMSMTKLINFPMMMLFFMIYLFIIMISVTTITNFNMGPLRMNK